MDHETLTDSIVCRVCGMRSFHPEDVKQGYCGRCHAFTAHFTDSELEAAIRWVHEKGVVVVSDVTYEVCVYCSGRKSVMNLNSVLWPCPTMDALEMGEIR